MRRVRGIPLSGVLLVPFLVAAAMAQQGARPQPVINPGESDPPGLPIPATDNSAYYRWSWQAFLWATELVDGDLRFTRMETPESIFGTRAFPGPPRPPLGAERGKLWLHARDAKSSDVRAALSSDGDKPTASGRVGGINQAGTNGILVDQRGRAVYYGTHLNRQYATFIRDHGYNDPAKIPKIPPLETFPVNTVMLKSSWRVVSPGDDVAGFYTTDAKLDRLMTDKAGRIVVDPTHPIESQRVALVGLHVVGRVEGHPEFLWSTFEHTDNAPLLPIGMAIGALDPVSTAHATFYTAKTLARDANQPHARVLRLDEPTQILSPISQVFRVANCGGAADAPLILAINLEFHGQPIHRDWSHYDLIGTLWSSKTNALEPNRAPTDQAGSTSLANTTMETFTQSAGNCFSCHDTKGYGNSGPYQGVGPKNVNLSHSLRQAFVGQQDNQSALLAPPDGKLPVPR